MSDRPKGGGEASLPLQESLPVPATAGGSSSGDVRRQSSEIARGAELSEDRGAETSGKGDGTNQPQISPEIDSAKQLSQYREKLARDMERQGLTAKVGHQVGLAPTRVSPIQEENTVSPTMSGSIAQAASSGSIATSTSTASTESGNTIRGGATPGIAARTPSYPFPRMHTPGYVPSPVHKPFTTLSPTGVPANTSSLASTFSNLRLQDKVVSSPTSPASTLTFQPTGASQSGAHPDFPTPNLYEMSLMLTAEPGLEAWWNTVIQIMTEVYRAERVTLAVPADSTDIENVPWGQKATYNARQEDHLSLGYMARGSSYMPSSTDDNSSLASQVEEILKPKLQLRPSFQSRHSFTSYEDEKKVQGDATSARLARPTPLPRSKSYFAGSLKHADISVLDPAHAALNRSALEEHDAEEQSRPSWEAPLEREPSGRVLPMLQALDYEADPLIDHNGVTRVLERGRVIALTRSYPYLDETSPERIGETRTSGRAHSPEGLRKKGKKRVDSSTNLSALLGSATGIKSSSRLSKGSFSDKKSQSIASRLEEEALRAPTPKYEEYEQAPPSPWSQSPAPSPAVRADPKENPFFTDAMVDEESFNPTTTPQDYAAISVPPEAIGVDNSWTVLHIPLTHILLSKPVSGGFKLDATLMEQKSSRKGKEAETAEPLSYTGQPTPDPLNKDKQTPIAILSVLSPTIPYPSNLRHSLEHLAPHLATSFSLARHYSSLESELAGLHRRRPQTAGFGAVDAEGRQLADPSSYSNMAYIAPDEAGSQRSLAGSMTSPSDYSGPSRSAAGSPSGTPGWDTGAFGLLMDKRPSASSPAQFTGDSYFTTKAKPVGGKIDVISSSAQQRARRNSKDSAVPEKRVSLRLSGGKGTPHDPSVLGLDVNEPETGGEVVGRTSSEVPSIAVQRRATPREQQPERRDEKVSEQRITPLGTPGAAHHRHTMLHSYGADFATTFQSLPPSSSVATKAGSVPSRSGSLSMSHVELPPPSDRLKGLMLDSLPAHVFVALPQTGEIVWVNSRYLAYRGQTAGDLAADPWGSIHPDDRDEYLKTWSHSVRTGEQFSRTVRIRRFDGAYRWFYARAVASRDKRNVIMQFLGSYMDIHDQHIAELKAARQEEIEASEAKHRLLANLIPQIIFTATEDEGITFANEQWLSYTGQSFDDSLGLGFMDFVHPDDLAKCRIPTQQPPTPAARKEGRLWKTHQEQSPSTKDSKASNTKSTDQSDVNLRGVHQALSRHNSSSSDSVYELPTANLTELARKGIIKVATDSNGRLSYTTEIRLRSKTGEYRWHLIRCVEIDNIDFGNGASSYFGSATDINDHKLLEAKLKEAMESKSRFLSNMSHEIRTPLIGISGMVSFLQDTILNEEQRDYTNTIQTSANSLLMIINDILDLSKVDAGMMKLSHEWFHTRSLIEDVNELVSTMAIAKRLELNYVVEEDVPAWIKGDRVRLRQVLLNVIGNAIKFTTVGEVFSRCKVKAIGPPDLDDNQIMLEFSIIDTGRGFSREEAQLIFKPFSQIDGSSTRQHGGSGLGLVISRQLVELHGGRMEGTAIPGKGSTFTFTARFGLPTKDDHPDAPATPIETLPSGTPLPENTTQAYRQLALNKIIGPSSTTSPTNTENEYVSPAVASSGSSNPSVHSGQTRMTDRSSMSSVNVGLVHFSEAARASGQDLSQMKLEMPSNRSSPGITPTPENQKPPEGASNFRPPMYSILIICPQTLSREATTKHIKMTLPKDVPYQITALASVKEAEELIGVDDPVIFTHVVLNLGLPEQIIDVMGQISHSAMADKTTILILSDSVQRQAVMKLAAGTEYEELLSENKVTYIYKPVKPSRFAVIFDPGNQSDTSIDRNRSTAQRIVESQKQSYLEVEKRMGNKGYKVLLVEDNPVNQKVLKKYLKKVGLEAEVAVDGVECTEQVFGHPHGYYSLILCDLHMPRKDGYQACREVRDWEEKNHYKKLPIIALSANVMSDVQEKCVAAGFSDYVTKPVDFIDLSTALSKFF